MSPIDRRSQQGVHSATTRPRDEGAHNTSPTRGANPAPDRISARLAQIRAPRLACARAAGHVHCQAGGGSAALLLGRSRDTDAGRKANRGGKVRLCGLLSNVLVCGKRLRLRDSLCNSLQVASGLLLLVSRELSFAVLVTARRISVGSDRRMVCGYSRSPATSLKTASQGDKRRSELLVVKAARA